MAFAIAYGLDRWEVVVRRQARENFEFASTLWFASAANLILASSLLALAWLLCFQVSKNQWVSLALVIIGLLATFAVAISFTIQSNSIVQRIPVLLFPDSRVADVSSFVAVIGIARFILFKNDIIKTRP